MFNLGSKLPYFNRAYVVLLQQELPPLYTQISALSNLIENKSILQNLKGQPSYFEMRVKLKVSLECPKLNLRLLLACFMQNLISAIQDFTRICFQNSYKPKRVVAEVMSHKTVPIIPLYKERTP